MAVSFRYRLLDEFLKEWQLRKKQLREGEITKEARMRALAVEFHICGSTAWLCPSWS